MVSLYQTELYRIEKSLEDSLENIDDKDVHGRFEAHKYAFDQLLGMVKVYGPILRSIKEEYESLVMHVIKNQQQIRISEEELKTACSYPITIENYERRCLELKDKLHRMRRDKEHKLEQVRDVQLKCQVLQKAMENVSNENESEPVKIRKELRRLPCMSLTSLTDLTTMQKMCDQLSNQRSQLQRTQGTKYVDKNEQVILESQLKQQIINHDQIRKEVKSLIRQKFLMQAALTEVRSFGGRSVNKNMGEIIVSSLINSAKSIEQLNDKSGEDSVEDEINRFFPESSKPISSIKESDYIVLCIRQFERLFQEEKYKEAVDLAVIIPRGVLRNYSTLLKFKEINTTYLLYYCQQLIATMKFGSLDSDMSYECVDIALKECRIDLVILWISKCRLQSTELIAENLTCHAELIPDHKIVCLDLASAMYWDLLVNLSETQMKESNKTSIESPESAWNISRRKFFDSILECRIKAGRIEEAIEMLTTENVTPVSARSIGMMYKEEDILLLVQYYPNIDLILALIRRNLITLESVFNVLLESENYAVFVNLLVHTAQVHKADLSLVTELLCKSVQNGIGTEAWEWMLNFVGESDEKTVIEIAASYLVKISLERSCLALLSLNLDY